MKKIVLLLMSILTVVSLSGCVNTKGGSQESNDGSQESIVENSINEQKVSGDKLKELIEVVGKNDEDVVKQLGAGEEDNNLVFIREYNMNILKGNALVTISYDENKVVDCVSILLEDTDYEKNIELLKESLGKYSETKDDSKAIENESKKVSEEESEERDRYAIWNLESSTLTLREAYGILSIEIRKNI